MKLAMMGGSVPVGPAIGADAKRQRGKGTKRGRGEPEQTLEPIVRPNGPYRITNFRQKMRDFGRDDGMMQPGSKRVERPWAGV
jgi:hypothetical protein